jgi:TonB family protein
MRNAVREGLLAFSVVLIGMSTGALADYDDGAMAYERGDFEAALREWLPLAKSGDERAQLNVGSMYLEGEGVEVDRKLALKWIRKAARQRFAPAQLSLGEMYEYGHGVEAEPGKAMNWYREAAQGGSPEAMMILSRRYLEGRLVEQDRGKAFEWVIRAAAGDHAEAKLSLSEAVDGAPPEQLANFVRHGWRLYQQGKYDLAALAWRTLADHGLSDAQYMLGKLYANGRGVLKDRIAAYKWLTIASRNPELDTQDILNELAGSMSPTQISVAIEQAAAWAPGAEPTAKDHFIPFPMDIGATEPTLIMASKVDPDYPESHRIERQQGRVILLAVIRKDGTIGEISILRSNMMHSDFEKAAYAAVSQWRYEPAMKDGKPVEVLFQIWVSFTIH